MKTMNSNPTQNKTDLSHIKNSEDLLHEIRLVRRRIKLREAELRSDLKQVPREAVRSTLGSVVPLFLRANVADKTLSIFQGLIALVVGSPLSKSGGGNMKSRVVNAAKQFGFLTAVKTVSAFLKKKKEKKPAAQETTATGQ